MGGATASNSLPLQSQLICHVNPTAIESHDQSDKAI